jgi:hypothetical protein
MLRKPAVAMLWLLFASFAIAPSARATGDVWVEGSYERLALPNVQFVNVYSFPGLVTGQAIQELVNDDGDFDGFRIDGGIDNIPIMDNAYMVDVKGFFAWHDGTSELQCANNVGGASGTNCSATPLIDNPRFAERVSNTTNNVSQFTTKRDVDHWGASIAIARGPAGLKAGPVFRRIDQVTTITGQEINPGGGPDPFQLTYNETLETNYWGAFVGADGAIDLGAGWSLQADGEVGLYWADTDFSGSYVVANSLTSFTINGNVDQQLSLGSSELAFIGVLKAGLEKDFGLFKLAGFGRVEYISSAPDVAYNDLDIGFAGFISTRGADDETRIGERYAYSISTGARITVPMGGQ